MKSRQTNTQSACTTRDTQTVVGWLTWNDEKLNRDAVQRPCPTTLFQFLVALYEPGRAMRGLAYHTQ